MAIEKKKRNTCSKKAERKIELLNFRKGKQVRIHKIRHEKDFTDYLGNKINLYLFHDEEDREYQLCVHPDGRIEIIGYEDL